MSDKIEIQGKTVDAAISEALLQMGARRDEVEIKVLEEPKGGFLGLLGGRPARVLVRKKRGGRRGGGRNQDHRQDQDGYGFSGDGQSRGGRGRRGGGRGSNQGSGRRDAQNENQGDNRRGGGGGRGRGGQQARQQDRQENRNDNRNDNQNRNERQADGERKSGGTRRGSRGGRGRGGRGRRQDAVAQDQNQNQNDNGGNQRRDAASRDDRGGRPERSERQDRGDNRNDNRKEQRQERSRRGGRGRGGRDESRQADNRQDGNSREQQRQERSRRDTRPAAAEVAPNETPTPTPVPAAEVKSVNELHPIRRAADVKKADPGAPAPAKPGKKKSFGGLGARRKSSLETAARKAEAREAEAQKAAEVRAQDTSAMDEAAARAKAKPGEIRRKGAPEGEGGGGSSAPRRSSSSRDSGRRDSSRREGGYPSREPGDEVIISEVKAVSYAKPVDAPADEAALDTLKELASGMLARAGFSCDVETRPDEYSQVIITTEEEDAGMLIGRHGQAVEAVEHLVERMASNAADDRVRMNLDINEYRVRRQESLLERVAEVVAEVRETGKAYHMESMDARERRLVHMGAADEEGIKTYTQMGGRGKHVVIAVDEGGDEDRNDDPVFTDEG